MAQYPKSSYIEQARKKLGNSGIEWQEFNNGVHFKVGRIDFWPTTGKWIDGNDEGRGVQELIKRLNPNLAGVKALTVEQIFDIAKEVKPCNLYEVCKAIHKEIYGKGKIC